MKQFDDLRQQIKDAASHFIALVASLPSPDAVEGLLPMVHAQITAGDRITEAAMWANKHLDDVMGDDTVRASSEVDIRRETIVVVNLFDAAMESRSGSRLRVRGIRR